MANIDLLNQDILQLLEYWDKNDLLKYDGTFNRPTRAQILRSVPDYKIYFQFFKNSRALSKVNVFLATLFDNWEINQFHEILENADEWVQYYNCTRTIVAHIYKSSINPTTSQGTRNRFLDNNEFQMILHITYKQIGNMFTLLQSTLPT